MICNQSNKPKLFHRYIRRKEKGKPPVGPLKIDNRVLSDPQEKNEVFVRSFSSVLSPVLPQVVNPHQESENDMSQIHLTVNKMFSQLNNLDESSAPGSDGVNLKLLKSRAVTLSYQLLLIYFKSLRKGKLPLAWKHSVVVLLLKSGSRNSPLNYRPFSLTSVCCKIMERILASHIMDNLEQNEVLSDKQFGF